MLRNAVASTPCNVHQCGYLRRPGRSGSKRNVLELAATTRLGSSGIEEQVESGAVLRQRVLNSGVGHRLTTAIISTLSGCRSRYRVRPFPKTPLNKPVFASTHLAVMSPLDSNAS